jgi:hypothetical protein
MHDAPKNWMQSIRRGVLGAFLGVTAVGLIQGIVFAMAFWQEYNTFPLGPYRPHLGQVVIEPLSEWAYYTVDRHRHNSVLVVLELAAGGTIGLLVSQSKVIAAWLSK